MQSFWSLIFLSWASLPVVLSSAGDRSYNFQKCLRSCKHSKCSHISECTHVLLITTQSVKRPSETCICSRPINTHPNGTFPRGKTLQKACEDVDAAYQSNQPIPMRWLRWTCGDDCQYNCMWGTVQAFELDDSSVPQFYGKWPFVRLWGIQEPAAALCSLLNGLAHFFMLLKFRSFVSSSAPMYWAWHFYAIIAMNAWFWATVFHARDLPFTELMDYACAVSLVFSALIILVIRVLGRVALWLVPVAAIASFYAYHVYYLAFVKFDYGYNMKVNITAGVLSGIGWLAWCYYVRDRQPYVWKCCLCIFALNALILLELGDFPPLGWVMDAHALWHLGTAPIPLLWYSFVIDDCHFMLKSTHRTKTQNNEQKHLKTT